MKVKAIIPKYVNPVEFADKIKRGMSSRFFKNTNRVKTRKYKFNFEPIIPKNVDPVKLADKIKGNLSSAWIKRRSRLKSRLVRQS